MKEEKKQREAEEKHLLQVSLLKLAIILFWRTNINLCTYLTFSKNIESILCKCVSHKNETSQLSFQFVHLDVCFVSMFQNTFRIPGLLKDKVISRFLPKDDHDDESTKSPSWDEIKDIKIETKKRFYTVEELLKEFVVLDPWFCLKTVITSLVFVVIPMVFDFMLFSQQIDYSQWKCVDKSRGNCSFVTKGGTIYNKFTFCSLNPRDSIPHVMFVDGALKDRTLLDRYFIRDVHFVWTLHEETKYPIRWGHYCNAEADTATHYIQMGVLLGGVAAGLVVDKFGRRTVVISSAMFGAFLILIQTLMNGYTGVVFVQVFQGGVYSAYFIASFIWVSENIPRHCRYLVIVFLSATVAMGRLLFAVLVTEVPNWNDISVVIMVLCLVISICTVLVRYVFPESLQFLLSHHLDREADRALSKVSRKWERYSTILEILSTGDQSHRTEDSFKSLFLHNRVRNRVLIVIYLWATSFLALTPRLGSNGLSLEVYYVVRAVICLLLQLTSCLILRRFPAKHVLFGGLLLSVICNVLSLSYTSNTGLNIAIQGVSESVFIIILFLSHEVIPMPQRASVLGIGFSLLGGQSLVNLRYFNPLGDGGDFPIRIVICVLSFIGSLLSYLLPHIDIDIPFTVIEAKTKTSYKSILISEKEAGSSPSTEEEVFQDSSTPPLPGSSHEERRGNEVIVSVTVHDQDKIKKLKIRQPDRDSVTSLENVVTSSQDYEDEAEDVITDNDNTFDYDDMSAHSSTSQEMCVTFRECDEEEQGEQEKHTQLKRFNTHMHLERVEIRSNSSSGSSSERWENKMRDIELKYDGENVDYITQECEPGIPIRILPQSTSDDTSDDTSDSEFLRFFPWNLMAQDGYMFESPDTTETL